jgi:arginine utilization protein RocB
MAKVNALVRGHHGTITMTLHGHWDKTRAKTFGENNSKGSESCIFEMREFENTTDEQILVF